MGLGQGVVGLSGPGQWLDGFERARIMEERTCAQVTSRRQEGELIAGQIPGVETGEAGGGKA
jgi:hypothetical protein